MQISLILTALISCLSEDVNSTSICPTLTKAEKSLSPLNSQKKTPPKSMTSEELILTLPHTSQISSRRALTDLSKKLTSHNSMPLNLKCIWKSRGLLWKKLLRVTKEREAWNLQSERENLQFRKEALKFLSKKDKIQLNRLNPLLRSLQVKADRNTRSQPQQPRKSLNKLRSKNQLKNQFQEPHKSQ